MASSNGNNSTNTARISFRSTKENLDKLTTIAKSRGWLNQRGQPNLSAVLNHLIDTFDASKDTRKVKRMESGRGKRRS